VFLVILFTSFSGSLVSRISGAVQFYIQEFSEYIAPLQDAVDLEIATEEERSLLEAWNKYRVLLNRVDTSVARKRTA
ncbi:tail fiber assembly protein, partial [Escherichia coli]|uniref:tail fiber assembly protein n=1 Tax=Escherichia coli TaxID=562 RepID=UPI00028DEDED